MKKRAFLLLTTAAGLFGLVSCTVHQTDTPSLTGPSGFGLSIGVTATPQAINQDGSATSTIVVTARDSGGKAIVGEDFRVDTFVNGSQVDFGTLQTRRITTGADGTASVIYTA